MSYVDAFYNKQKDLIQVVERVDGQRKFKDIPAKYVFYYPDNKGKYKSIYGQPLSKVAVNNHKAFEKEKRIYSGKKLYESDIKPVFRCLEDEYPNGDTPELNVCFFDIEVNFDKEKGFADPSDPFNNITSITLYLSWLDRLITVCLKPNTLSTEQAEEICSRFENTVLCSTEEEMLDMFIQLVDDADILSGWNSEGFDIPYTFNRIARVMGQDHCKRFCLWGQKPKAREFEKYGKTAVTYDLIGRVHLDYLELYRKYTYHELHTYRLDYVGEYELGETKVHYEGTLDQLYNNDFEKFIAYNRQDVMLLVKLDKKLQYIDLVNVLAHANCVLFPTTMGAVAVTDQAVIREAHNRGLIVPDRTRDHAETQAAGAYVAYPKKGIHEWIGSMDLNSLYPSVIRALNMSPETIVGQLRLDMTKKMIKDGMDAGKSFADCWDGRFATMEYEAVMTQDIGTDVIIDWENGRSEQVSGKQAYEMIFLSGQNLMVSANGTIFNFTEKGVIPGLLERWYSERKDLQKKAKACSDNEKEFEFWDKRQLVKKINLNSAYGALLNAGSRFFDQRLGQSTTLTGRCIARHMAAQVNAMFTGEYNHVGETIIYGDTDSVYFSAWPVFKGEAGRGEIDWSKEKIVELYDTVSNEVNDTFPAFMNRAFNVPGVYAAPIKAGREVVASKGIYMTKKRYAVLIYDKEGKRKDLDGEPGEVKAMGLDLKRADTPEFMQKFLEEILLMLLTGEDRQKILDRILDFRKSFKAKPAWEKGTPKRVNNLTQHTAVFNKTGKCGVGHAMAAINWNRIKKMHNDQFSMDAVDGMKVVVCKLKNNPLGMTSIAYPTDEQRLPLWFKELPFDEDAMEETIIDNKIDNLLGVLGWDLQSTKMKNTFNLLFE
jgi:DNA polymerase elongation subunit (family B)